MLSIVARLVPRVALLIAVALIGETVLQPMIDHPKIASCSATLLFKPATRIRKLHLVRPDLIPYPLAMEIYC